MLRLLVTVLLASAIAIAQPDRPEPHAASQSVTAIKANIPYADARPIIEAVSQNLLPPELRGRTRTELEAAWPVWVSRHDVQIRARLERGDEDSIINLLLFGVTFTERPRVKELDILKRVTERRSAEITQDAIVQGRVDDLVAGIASPGANERLQFARQVVEHRGIDPRTPDGKNQLRHYLDESIHRVLSEYETYSQTQAASRLSDTAANVAHQLTLFQNRGLSSDTSIIPDFAIEQALRAIKSQAILDAKVLRVAIIGPGLDFTDRREGYDFCPEQTLQPFAVIDSLIRLGLATPNDLRLTTLDISPRINGHLDEARQRVRAGGAYVLQVPHNTEAHLNPDLVAYWERFGSTIGDPAVALAPPPAAGNVKVRAVRIRPPVVMSIIPQDLNIVLQRLEPGTADEQFDLIIATNILIYYDIFDQCLALANIAKMLRPGGLFLTNQAMFEVPSSPIMKSAGFIDVAAYTDRPQEIDRLFWYRRP